MMYPYTILADGTEVTHSHIIKADGLQTLEVHFERPKESGFDSARCILPSFQWKFLDGFSNEEISFFIVFLKHNFQMLYDAAARRGRQ